MMMKIKIRQGEQKKYANESSQSTLTNEMPICKKKKKSEKNAKQYKVIQWKWNWISCAICFIQMM